MIKQLKLYKALYGHSIKFWIMDIVEIIDFFILYIQKSGMYFRWSNKMVKGAIRQFYKFLENSFRKLQSL